MMQRWLKNSWTRGLVLALILLLVAIGLYWFMGRSHFVSPSALETSPTNKIMISNSTIPEYADLVGVVMPSDNSLVKAEVAGQITAVFAVEGEYVAAEQLLAKIDDAEYRLELDQAVQRRESLQAIMDNTLSQYQRSDRLLKKKAATAVDWENAKAAYGSARATLEEAVKNEDRLQVRLNKTNVVAPYDAVIGKKFIQKGELATVGTPLFWVYASEDFEVDVEVPERYMAYIKVGDKAEVSIDQFDLSTVAIVTEIVPLGDTRSHTFLVKARLADKGKALPNSVGHFQIPVGQREALLIPRQAIENIGQLQMVRVLDEKTWKRRYIRAGRDFNGMVEVLSGLKAGETLGYD